MARKASMFSKDVPNRGLERNVMALNARFWVRAAGPACDLATAGPPQSRSAHRTVGPPPRRRRLPTVRPDPPLAALPLPPPAAALASSAQPASDPGFPRPRRRAISPRGSPLPANRVTGLEPGVDVQRERLDRGELRLPRPNAAAPAAKPKAGN